MSVRQATEHAPIEDPDLFMAMNDLELIASGIVEGALHGLHRSPYLGFSAEFDAHRDYQPGDDLRHVNWNLWARTDRLYVKQFKADTNLNLYLLLDGSASMRCAHGPVSKWGYGARAAAALAYLSLRSRDAAGLFVLGGDVREYIPPKVRPGQLREIVALLERFEAGGTSNIARELEEVMHLCRRRGIVVFISDLFDEDDRVLRALQDLQCCGHDIIVLHILDPWEEELPAFGQFDFRDLETGQRMRTDAETVRQAVATDVDSWRAELRRRCVDSGFDWIQTSTRDPLAAILVDYLLQRSGMA